MIQIYSYLHAKDQKINSFQCVIANYEIGDKKTVRREIKTLLIGSMLYVLCLVTHSL